MHVGTCDRFVAPDTVEQAVVAAELAETMIEKAAAGRGVICIEGTAENHGSISGKYLL